MNTADFVTHRDGDFIVQEFGQGAPRQMCIGGLQYAPSDYHPLVREMNGTVYIINKPEWLSREQLIRGYIDEFRRHHCECLVYHSGGCDFELEMQEEIRIPTETGSRLTHKIHIAPVDVSRARELKPEARFPDGDFLDALFAPLCKDLSDEQYRDLLIRHFREYGGMTDTNPVDVRKMKRALRQYPTQERADAIVAAVQSSIIPILGIFPEEDPIGLCGSDFGPMVTVTTVPRAYHFPHISKPKIVAERIKEWQSSAAFS